MLNRIIEPPIFYFTGKFIDVLEWLYDHDVKSRKFKPFGG